MELLRVWYEQNKEIKSQILFKYFYLSDKFDSVLTISTVGLSKTKLLFIFLALPEKTKLGFKFNELIVFFNVFHFYVL